MSVLEENNVYIRKVELSDIPYLYEICFVTGFRGEDACPYYKDSYLLGQFYAACYALFAKEDSFVLVDKENGLPCGYIVGTRDSYSFYEKRNQFLAGLKDQCLNHKEDKTSYEKDLKNMILENINKKPEKEVYFEEYPAHFHIDIKAYKQGKKLGNELIKAFLENLRSNNVKGVHLGVDGENKRACHFYEKEGFSVVEKTEWGFVLGMRL